MVHFYLVQLASKDVTSLGYMLEIIIFRSAQELAQDIYLMNQ